MTDLQELMALLEKWRADARNSSLGGFPQAAAMTANHADELETILRSPAFAEMARDKARLDSGRIVIHSRDEFGEPCSTEHIGINMRAAIDAAASGGGHG